MPILKNRLCGGLSSSKMQDGNILIYVVVVMMLFAALGTALVSIYSTSNLIAVISDDAKQARYLAESGIRYAMAELKQAYTRTVIQTLNITEYKMSNEDAFDVNVFPKWFIANATVSIPSGGGSIDLNVPDNATIPSGFMIKAGVYLVNIDSLRDAIAFSGGVKELFISKVWTDSTNLDADTLRVQVTPVGTTFELGENQPVHLAVYPNASYAAGENPIPYDGSGDLVVGLDDPATAETVFHKNGGTFYVLNPSTGARRMYSYEEYTTDSPMTLKKIRGFESLSIDKTRDLIIFSDKNHTITAQGKTGPSSSEALESVQIDMPQNTSSTPLWAPETPEETPADINFTKMIEDAATPASTSGVVQIDTSDPIDPKIKLGLGVGSASAAVWYGGTQDVGGVSGDFCSAGKCKFEYGMRAYFTFNYNGTGDGFTFALTNGQDNSVSSLGSAGEYLGYAGAGAGSGIQPPKMALEFDTYTNSARNDPGTSNKDYLNFDFWGISDSDLNDDNIHDTWESASSLSNNVRCRPYVESSGNVLVVSTDGRLYRINTRGETISSFNLGIGSDSSPIVDGAGRIWVGTNGAIFVVDSSLSTVVLPFTRIVGGAVRTVPAYDPVTGHVFFGSDYNGPESSLDQNHCNLCVINSSDGSFSWGFNSGDAIQGSPVIKNGFVYFGGNSGGGDVWKYYTSGPRAPAPSWSSPYTTDSDVQVRPVVSSSETVYFGSWENDSYFHAVRSDKVQKWTYNTGFVSIFSSAVLDESRSRVYFGTTEVRSGSYDGKVYALNSETGALVWSYQTGGAIYSSPVVGDDGAVFIGSNDGFLYAFEPDGVLRWKIDLKGEVRSSLALSSGRAVAYVGSDHNKLFSVPVTGNPWQFKTWDDMISGTPYYRHLTYGDNLPSDALAADNPISSSDNWLNSGPWAVRVEVDRAKTPNSQGTYDYTIRSWIRQCKLDPGDCSEITGTYFSDTRIAYEAKPAQMSQSFELSETDHQAFETYYNGFTQATGGATQTVTIRNIRIGFIRPGDYIVVSDSDWQ